MKTIKAKSVSYGAKRDLKGIRYIVIHYTGVKGDTAVNEGTYFAKSNTRAAGAHFFIDRKGVIVKSIPMNLTAWSVGGAKYSNCKKTGGGKYHGIVTNYNSVSIELCDIADQLPSEEQIKATKRCVAYIRKHCPNIKKIVRHFDVTGKSCPATMVDDKVWKQFLYKI